MGVAKVLHRLKKSSRRNESAGFSRRAGGARTLAPRAVGSPPPTLAAARLRRFTRLRPTLAIVLGSGFQNAVPELESATTIPYAQLPGFPPAAVAGHAGEVLCGRLGATPVLVLRGRAHYYEGHAMERVTFAVRALAAFGIRDLLLTNAAGGLRRRFRPGDFMLATDHINGMGANPLRGRPAGGESGFVDLTGTYDAGLGRLLRQAARECGARLHAGVYLAVSGPSYETPAEIRAFARLGADAVGMSTVPEAIVARQCGMRVAAVSCITNLAAGLSDAQLSHAEVLKTGQRVRVLAAQMLKKFMESYGRTLNMKDSNELQRGGPGRRH
jgi:purine-nucleoside phosphorylase